MQKIRGRRRKKELIRQLKNYPVTGVGDGQVEKCIRQLPEVEKTFGVFRLVWLQYQYMSKGVYLFLAVLAGGVACAGGRMDMRGILVLTGFAQCVLYGFFFACLLASGYSKMSEIEQTCRYGREKIFFARLFCGISFIFSFLLVCNLLFYPMGTAAVGVNLFYLIPLLLSIYLVLAVLGLGDFRGAILVSFAWLMCCAAGNLLFACFYQTVVRHIGILVFLSIVLAAVDICKIKHVADVICCEL